MTSIQSKQNVQIFERDVTMAGGYQYSNSDADISKRFSNSRTSQAIASMADFRDKRVLDLGCGDGTFTFELLDFGAKFVLGVDPATTAIKHATLQAEKAGVSDRLQFASCSVYDMGDSYGHFDIVMLRGVLHHLPDAEAALKAVSPICDEIVIVEPNGCNPVLKLIEKFSTYHIEHEEQSFMPRTINNWLLSARKTPVSTKMVNFVPLFCPPTLARLLKFLEPIVEAIPIVRLIGCGQYIVKASSIAR
ncbi:class I SAM-dependent methyltransferase [Methylobacterium sp. WL120]|uniref:class I SAM-dependent methyltransferase n=1 Tax=Methylobacterium sp. WL120 TaxID=2603887 RepID=UPI0011C990E3|nr:class I SAM-dependent methyltransferase [Methylobacterium sp. WL120]TXM67228.1 class I SAM-dependent methyltransferase [Methylobacterium sp. WL120]